MRPFNIYEDPSFQSDAEDEDCANQQPGARSRRRGAVTVGLTFTVVVAIVSTLSAKGFIPMPSPELLGGLRANFMKMR